MKKNLDEKELLDFYEHHLFEDRKDNLSEIRKRLSISEETVKACKKLRRKMRICYGISCASFLFALLIFGGYRYLLMSDFTRTYALSATTVLPRLILDIQSPETVSTIFTIAITALAAGICFLAAGFLFSRKRKKKNF
jgi:LPXTG-motif cell wall-anchored protein